MTLPCTKAKYLYHASQTVSDLDVSTPNLACASMPWFVRTVGDGRCVKSSNCTSAQAGKHHSFWRSAITFIPGANQACSAFTSCQAGKCWGRDEHWATQAASQRHGPLLLFLFTANCSHVSNFSLSYILGIVGHRAGQAVCMGCVSNLPARLPAHIMCHLSTSPWRLQVWPASREPVQYTSWCNVSFCRFSTDAAVAVWLVFRLVTIAAAAAAAAASAPFFLLLLGLLFGLQVCRCMRTMQL